MYKPAPYKGGHQTRVLIDRRAALGDLVMITPVLREMRKRYPEAWMQVVTDEPGILKNNPHVDSVVMPADMQKSDPWDIYLNLNDAYEKQVTSHYVDSYLHRAFGANIDAIDHSPEMFPTVEEKEAVDDAVAEIGSDYIVVHMRRWAWENKNIDLEIWSSLFTRLQNKYPGVKIVSVGAKYDYTVPPNTTEFINLVGQLSVGEIQYLISRARAFVGPDSGPFHIAGTTTTPIVALISHLLPEQILPWRGGEFGKDITVVLSDVSCTGCYARQTPPVNNLTCENETQWACSKSFDNLKIFNALEAILDK
jgi:ADP-heptose:LPS heptosyltransferase